MSRFDDFISSPASEGHEQKIKDSVQMVLLDNKKQSQKRWFLTWFYPLIATTASVGFFLFEYQRQRREQMNTPGVELGMIDVSAPDLIAMSEIDLNLIEDIDILENWEEIIEEENG